MVACALIEKKHVRRERKETVWRNLFFRGGARTPLVITLLRSVAAFPEGTSRGRERHEFGGKPYGNRTHAREVPMWNILFGPLSKSLMVLRYIIFFFRSSHSIFSCHQRLKEKVCERKKQEGLHTRHARNFLQQQRRTVFNWPMGFVMWGMRHSTQPFERVPLWVLDRNCSLSPKRMMMMNENRSSFPFCCFPFGVPTVDQNLTSGLFVHAGNHNR